MGRELGKGRGLRRRTHSSLVSSPLDLVLWIRAKSADEGREGVRGMTRSWDGKGGGRTCCRSIQRSVQSDDRTSQPCLLDLKPLLHIYRTKMPPNVRAFVRLRLTSVAQSLFSLLSFSSSTPSSRTAATLSSSRLPQRSS